MALDKVGSRAGVWKVAIEDLVIDEGFNARISYDEEKLYRLAQSIAKKGVRRALTGYERDGRCVITDGHRRYKAIQIAIHELGAPIKAVNVIPEGRGHDAASRTMTILTANSGEPLTPLEIGLTVQRMVRYGWEFAEMAESSTYSAKYLEDCYMMATSDASIVNAVKSGEISDAAAIEAVRKYGDDGALPALEKAKAASRKKGSSKATLTHLREANATKLDPAEKDAMVHYLNSTGWGHVDESILIKVHKLVSKNG